MTEQNVPKYFADFLTEFGKFRDENSKAHGDIYKWVAGLFLVQTGVIIGAIQLFG